MDRSVNYFRRKKKDGLIMKKLLVIFMTVFMVFSFVACTSDIYKIDPTIDNSVDINDANNPSGDDEGPGEEKPSIVDGPTGYWNDSEYADVSWYMDYLAAAENDPYVEINISNAGMLAGLAKIVNGEASIINEEGEEVFIDAYDFANKTVNITKDIDLGAHLWVPIGTEENPFRGGVHGGTHTISNVIIKELSADLVAGLFGVTDNTSTMHHIILKNVDIDVSNENTEEPTSVGALIGKAYGDVYLSGTYITGSIKGLDCIGGAIGRISANKASGVELNLDELKLAVLKSQFGLDYEYMSDEAENELAGIGFYLPTFEHDFEGNMTYDYAEQLWYDEYIELFTGASYSNSFCQASISDVSTYVKIEGSGIAGGVIGCTDKEEGFSLLTEIFSCSSSGEIKLSGSANLTAGGVLGSDKGSFYMTVLNCASYGIITLHAENNAYDSSLFAGGIYGDNDSCPLVVVRRPYNSSRISVFCPEDKGVGCRLSMGYFMAHHNPELKCLVVQGDCLNKNYHGALSSYGRDGDADDEKFSNVSGLKWSFTIEIGYLGQQG